MGRGELETKPALASFPVDKIRFIAIFLIIFLHASGYPYRFLTPETTSIDIINWFTVNAYDVLGRLGVPLFVMLSGALLLNPEKAKEPLRIFYKKRLNRIALPFVFWTIIYFIWTFTVLNWSPTISNVIQGLLSGSYYHLWYLYLLMGLYAVTPILRVLIKHLNRKLFTYLLILWFAGTTITPFIHTFTDFNYHPVAFVFFDWIGYFLLGSYLLCTKIRRSRLYLISILGLLGSVLGDWLVTALVGQAYTGYFHNYMSPTIIIGSLALFLILIKSKTSKIESHPKLVQIINWVSKNTLPIYLIHMIILITFTNGIFGYYLNTITFIPLLDAPIFALIVFGISASLVFILKKIPYLKKLVG